MITAENIDLSPRDGKTIPFGSINGTTLGQSGDKIGFFGVNPAARRAQLFAPVKKLCTIGAKATGHSGGSVDWIPAAAADLFNWTLAASATGAKMIVPVSGLNVGDVIVGFGVTGQIESGGNAATLDANLRKLTAAASEPTDASVASITQISVTADTAVSPANGEVRHFNAAVTSSDTFYVLLTGTTAASTDVDLLNVYVLVQPAGNLNAVERRYFNAIAKVGGTAGWVVAAATDLVTFTMAASQTAGTLVIPLNGLRVGDRITGFNLLGQIESGGLAVTLDAQLQKTSTAADDLVNSVVATMTQLSVTADTAVTLANTLTDGFSATVAAGESYYLLVTGTTLASTDIALMGAQILITPADNPQAVLLNAGGKVGAGSGFTVAGATDVPTITVAASQTAATMVLPITGLQSGDIITGIAPIGQIESAGGTVTVDVALRKLTVAAAANVDALVKGITQISKTADAALGAADGRSDLYYEIGADENPYVLVTVTTAGSTDVALQGVQLTVHSSVQNQMAEIVRRFGLAGV